MAIVESVHRSCFPLVQCSASVASVPSHWLSCPHNLPCGPSSQCHSNSDSGPRSVMPMFSLCVCLCALTHVCVCVFLFWATCFSPFLSEGAGDMKKCCCSDTGETERDDGEEQGQVRRSSAAATGRGQRGWQCLLVASLSTWLCRTPAWGQRRVTQHITQYTYRVV